MANDPLLELASRVGEFRYSPLKHALFCYPWETERLPETGPRTWQREEMLRIEEHLSNPLSRHQPLRIAKATGHGVGKSGLVAMLNKWGLDTCVDTRIVITANTESQLLTKTSPEIAKWNNLASTRLWFKDNAMSLVSTEQGHGKSWRSDLVTWSEKNTEAFAGLHNKGRRIILIFDEACHDDKTEVLAERGWIKFSEMTGEDRLLTMDPATRVAEYLKPTALHASHRDGEMVVCEKRGCSFSVTPNHRMFVETQSGQVAFRDAGELAALANMRCAIPRTFKWEAEDMETFTIPALETQRKKYSEKVVPADEWFEFLGWYCSEGHLIRQGEKVYGVGLSQTDCSHLFELCFRLGFNPRISPSSSTPQVLLHGAHLARWLAQWGVGCKVKRVPDCVRQASARQINIFLNAYRDGDGYSKDGRDILYTSSKALADDLQELCFKAGQQSTVMKRPLEGRRSFIAGHTATSSCDGYVVSRSWSGEKLALKTRQMERRDYSGMVYCATLPRHNLLFTRRDGVCMWSGNSGIVDKVWEVALGALTDEDTEIIWLAFGNPTKNTGAFRQCFGKQRNLWHASQLDSRDVEGTNKEYLQSIVDSYGLDHDITKVRVLGQFPSASSMQFISMELAEEARERDVPERLTSDPLVYGLDCARFGDDSTVLAKRQGRDARTRPWKQWSHMDAMTIAGDVALEARKEHPDAIFVDAGNIGAAVVDRLRQLLGNDIPIIEVWFGSKGGMAELEPNITIRCKRKRDLIWTKMRHWLRTGATPEEQQLIDDLTGPEYGFDDEQAVVLERKQDMKKRDLPSPDWADALATTFAEPVMPRSVPGYLNPDNYGSEGEDRYAELD